MRMDVHRAAVARTALRTLHLCPGAHMKNLPPQHKGIDTMELMRFHDEQGWSWRKIAKHYGVVLSSVRWHRGHAKRLAAKIVPTVGFDQVRANYGAFFLAMNPTYNYATFQQEILAPALERVVACDPAYSRLIITMPFRFGKTDFGTLNFVPFYLGHHPDHNVILLSYGKRLARSFGRQIRDKMRSDLYRALFPESVITKSSHAADEFSTISGGKFYASGFDGTVNGLGANCLIIDDPTKNRAEAMSDTVQIFHRDLYNNVVRTRLEPDASILVVTTRWTPNDLVGWRVQEDGAVDALTGKPYDDLEAAAA